MSNGQDVPEAAVDLVSEKIAFADNTMAAALFGELHAHLRLTEARLRVVIQARGNEVVISGEKGAVEQALRLLTELYSHLEQGGSVDVPRVEEGLQMVGEARPGQSLFTLEESLQTPRRTIFPRNPRQQLFLRTMRKKHLTLAVGPAGTGKTYLAVAMGVVALLRGEVERIVLTRPVVEAGEHLGFLPGDLQAKVDPYIRPLYDALFDMLGTEKVERMLAQNALEIAPLAFMRGRTLSRVFAILDEAQNTTREQMKMFLTRLGEGSSMVVCGDITQVDLPGGRGSGLMHALAVLEGIDEIGICHFSERDVVRHSLVRQIVRAYETHEQTGEYVMGPRRSTGTGATG
ncbi:MAG: PhoH family protein [Magnetococcales bacterium]|nr:PhoH family protein [Magnetococcales bacterium]